jgi:GNAT superfamily N-acetyltransferase
MKLVLQPLTPELWSAVADLFSDSPVCGRCWCMAPRIGNSYRRRPPEANEAAFRAIVEQGPSPGLLAFDDNAAVAWCQVTPRDAVPWLDRNWRLKRVDDVPVWSLSCFYVRKGHRRQGFTSLLIDGALRMARRAGAPALEAYPLDRDNTPSATSTGVVSTFVAAGFTEVARHAPPRPVMRYDLRQGPAKLRHR